LTTREEIRPKVKKNAKPSPIPTTTRRKKWLVTEVDHEKAREMGLSSRQERVCRRKGKKKTGNVPSHDAGKRQTAEKGKGFKELGRKEAPRPKKKRMGKRQEKKGRKKPEE